MKISNNKYVKLAYDLYVGEGEDREQMERATAEDPLEFIFGTGSLLDAFEKEIVGLDTGDTFSFQLTPEAAYGEYFEERVVELPKNIFQVNGKIDKEMLFEGNTLPMMDSSGNRLMGSVVTVGDDTVTMDFNHPLAGETLHFNGSVVEVREATAEEIASLSSCYSCTGDGCDCDDSDCGCGGC